MVRLLMRYLQYRRVGYRRADAFYVAWLVTSPPVKIGPFHLNLGR